MPSDRDEAVRVMAIAAIGRRIDQNEARDGHRLTQEARARAIHNALQPFLGSNDWIERASCAFDAITAAGFLMIRPVPDAGLRDEIASITGYHFAALVSRNNQPCMSGDPRDRLLPHVRRRFDDGCSAVADAILPIIHAREAALLARVEKAEADAARMREALEPSGGTKACYSAEIKLTVTGVDEDGEEIYSKILLPWTTIKDVMALIRKRAARADYSAAEGTGGGNG